MNKSSEIVYSSESDEWYTPAPLFAGLHAEFGFALDAAAKPACAKCPAFFTKEDDGLSQPWLDPTFLNPPYGRTIARWMKKAYEESRKGSTVVCLVPARTDTAWWNTYVMRAAELRFVVGRVRFDAPDGHGSVRPGPNSATFPSVVVVFRPGIYSIQRVTHIDQNGQEVPLPWSLYVEAPEYQWEQMTAEEQAEADREQATFGVELDRFEASRT